MRRLILILAIIVLTAAPAMSNPEWTKASSSQTASAAITATGGLLHGIMFVTDATNAVTVNVYDNATAASGNKLVPTDVIITTGASDRWQSFSISPPVRYKNGIYVEITTAGTVAYMVYFETQR